MKKSILLILVTLLLTGCNSVKRNQKFLASGNYDQAIGLAVKKLQKDKNDRKSHDHVVLLQEAFKKAVERDKRYINSQTKDNSLEALGAIYDTYYGMQRRQDIIRPLLPLYSNHLNGNAEFKFVDYTNNIQSAKERYADRLLVTSQNLLSTGNKMDARNAYSFLEELEGFRPNNSNIKNLKQQAIEVGTDFVHVALLNRSGQVIPYRLEQELLDFNTYNLDDFWTEYHEERQNSVDYDFGIRLIFRDIAISPERISEKEYKRKKHIKDGWEYKLDRNGNVMKDSLGNDIKVDVYKWVTARVTYTTQTKSVLVGGDVLYRNLQTNRDIDRHPLSSEFVFQNEFARFRGDERALTEEDLDFIEFDFIPFPSHEQMILDAGDDIKARLTDILKNNRLR
ncbi:MAG: lipoprotein [Flavobacteriaceae bacterium]|nr:lipoprotein [Flavobacteriaceae bacterium]